MACIACQMVKDTPEIFLNLLEFHNKSNMFTFYKLFSAFTATADQLTGNVLIIS